MKTIILDGKNCAQKWREEIRASVEAMAITPKIVVILVGNNPASEVYVRNKEKAAKEAGFDCHIERLGVSITNDELLARIHDFNRDNSIHGYIVQLPLPPHINPEIIAQNIDPRKDVDGASPENQGLLLRGTPRYIPATPLGIIELLRKYGIQASGKNVVIVGRSAIVGRPMAGTFLLKGEMGDSTVTVAHSLTPNLALVCQRADILVAAIGKPKFITGEFVRPGAVVIDVGINSVDGKLCGDVDFEEVKDIASAITPVPGGVGPMTIAALLYNTLQAAKEDEAWNIS